MFTFKSTVSIANLGKSGKISGQEEGQSSESGNDEDAYMDDKAPPTGKLVLSLAGGDTAMRLELPLPLTEAMWKQLTGMLEAVKHTLVSEQAKNPTE